MRKVIAIVFFLLFVSVSFGQSILTSGCILESEFTPDKKISGLFTYMNNSDQTLLLRVERNSPVSEIILEEEIITRRGKQLRVFRQEYSSAGQQIFGKYTISFFHINESKKNDLVFRYENTGDNSPNLRVVSVIFNGLNQDDYGKYFDVRIDWQNLHEETQTDNRKCYLIN